MTGAPVDSVVLRATRDGGGGFNQPLCLPADPIEQTPGCPDPPVVLLDDIGLWEGNWTVEARVTRGASVETATIRLTVLPPTTVPAGTIALARLVPTAGSPSIVVRDPDPDHPDGISTTPEVIRVLGENLDNNPFLEVYVAPIPVNEPSLTPESGLPVVDWCRFQAAIVGRGISRGGESFLDIVLPELPIATRSICSRPGRRGSIFTQNWRVLIRDRWIRAERVHEWWAIPSPRVVPWHDAAPLRMVKPRYPLVDGFGFDNHGTDAKYKEFLTVFGNNAYLCIGAFGFCATRIPDPLYHLLWWPIYLKAIDNTGGSCNGMASTSLLMAREELQPEPFETNVHFPVGFDSPGPNAVLTVREDEHPGHNHTFLKGVATYDKSSFCTPFCGPYKPKNLWAQIRMNHGVQISREFLFEVIKTLGTAIFDPSDLSTLKGVPNATLARVAADPDGYVLCFFQPGNGHCVTPYRVDGNRIWIYDNNEPGDDSRFIDIVGGSYDYPARTKDPNHGKAIMAFPIDLWKEGRHLLGLDELVALISGDIVEFLYMIAVGSGDMIVTNDAGGRWGWEDDGTFTDAMLGGVSIAPLGPQDTPARAMPLLVAMNQPAPTVQMTGDGGTYTFHSGAGGHLLQLEARAMAGDKDRIQLGYIEGGLGSFDFTPQRDCAHLVPRIGLAIDEGERALFHWLGLVVPAGRSVGFDADKQARTVSFRNDTGLPASYVLALDHASATTEDSGRMIFGPFDVPNGATQTVVLADWPAVSTVVSEIDIDRDGTPDRTEIVTGRPAASPLGQETTADLSVVKTVLPTTVGARESFAFTITVANAGPQTAADIMLFEAIPAGVDISLITTTQGTCTDADGVSCNLGFLRPGQTAVVTYVATPTRTRPLTTIATVFGNEGDPDLTNNTAALTVSPRLPGDFDDDGDVDLSDYLNLIACLRDSGQPLRPGCEDADLDGDGDGDLADLLAFQAAFTGPR